MGSVASSVAQQEAGSSAPWGQLPMAVQLHILSLLPPNECALSGRLLCRDTADGLHDPQHRTAFLSQPLPPHAAAWAHEALQQHARQRPIWEAARFLCMAAASGSQRNLETVRRVLQSRICQEPQYQFHAPYEAWFYSCDPGIAAVRAGHPKQLGWLLRHYPDQTRARHALAEAAQCCDLAGLQAAWEAVQMEPAGASRACCWVCVHLLQAAASSKTPDALAKLEWMRTAGGLALDEHTAAGAVQSGDLPRLLWLRDRGCPVNTATVLQHALRHADLAVAEWLVGEAGCKLPEAGVDGDTWDLLMLAAAGSADGVTKLQWLRERGASPLLSGDGVRIKRLPREAVRAGQVEVVRYLISALGRDRFATVVSGDDAAASGNIPMAEVLRQAGIGFTSEAYREASHNLPMLRWLVCEAAVSTAELSLSEDVLSGWHTAIASRGDLMEVVQLLLGAGGYRVCAEDVYTAAGLGDLDIVQYLLQQQPEQLSQHRLLEEATDSGCEALLEWLVQQLGYLEALAGTSLYVRAVERRDLATLAALRRLGAPWGAEDVVLQVLKEGFSFSELRWLVEQGAPLGSVEEVAAVVAEEGYFSADEAAWLRCMMGIDMVEKEGTGAGPAGPCGRRLAVRRAAWWQRLFSSPLFWSIVAGGVGTAVMYAVVTWLCGPDIADGR